MEIEKYVKHVLPAAICDVMDGSLMECMPLRSVLNITRASARGVCLNNADEVSHFGKQLNDRLWRKQPIPDDWKESHPITNAMAACALHSISGDTIMDLANMIGFTAESFSRFKKLSIKLWDQSFSASVSGILDGAAMAIMQVDDVSHVDLPYDTVFTRTFSRCPSQYSYKMFTTMLKFEESKLPDEVVSQSFLGGRELGYLWAMVARCYYRMMSEFKVV